MRSVLGPLGVLSALLLWTVPAQGQPTDIQADAAILIAETAERICGSGDTSGSSSRSQVEGEVGADLAVLSRRLVDIGIEGAGVLEGSEYQGVLREQLADELKDSRQCRLKVFDQMFARVFGATPRSVLEDKTDDVLSGSRLPHTIEIVQPGQLFVMKTNESVALGSLSKLFTVNAIVQHNNVGPLVYFNWVDTISGKSARNRNSQAAQPIVIGECNVVPYTIDVSGDAVSFLSNC